MERNQTNKKILLSLFLPNLHGGGAEKVLTSLATQFAEYGIDVDFVLVKAVGVNLKNLSDKVTVIDLNASHAFLSLPKLIQYLRKRRPEMLISALDLTNLIAIIARRISRVESRLFIRIENTVSMQRRAFWKKRLEKILLSFFYPWADGLIAVSQNVAADIAVYAGVSPSKIYTIYNPVVTRDMLERSRSTVTHRWLTNGKAMVVLGVGRLNEQKDFSNLIKAFALVRRKMEAKLIILGEGEERPLLEQLVKDFNIVDDVALLGYVENPYPYMRSADVFVLSSRWEGLPTVLIEAMACGAPVVSTDCPGGSAEILDGGHFGHLVPVENARALAGAIEASLLGDQRKPPSEWLNQFDAETVIRQYFDIMGVEKGLLSEK
jgi:glycosyltransferase involved in cell wall biosynthesis